MLLMPAQRGIVYHGMIGLQSRQQIPETSINYSKVLQSSALCRNPDQTVSDQGLKHQSWEQEQVV